jgi:hypothetical protein
LIAKTASLHARTVHLHAQCTDVFERSRDPLWLPRHRRAGIGSPSRSIAGASDGGSVDSIHGKVIRGLLPRERPLRAWVGWGNGRGCDSCGLMISATDIEHEFDFASGRTIRFHEACMVAWWRATRAVFPNGHRPLRPTDN